MIQCGKPGKCRESCGVALTKKFKGGIYMISKIKKPVSILLVFMMIVSLFTIVPLSASAAVGDFVPESEYLTFTAVEAGSSVTLKVASCD